MLCLIFDQFLLYAYSFPSFALYCYGSPANFPNVEFINAYIQFYAIPFYSSTVAHYIAGSGALCWQPFYPSLVAAVHSDRQNHHVGEMKTENFILNQASLESWRHGQ